MTLRESQHAVWLRSDRVGTLFQRGDHTRFVLVERVSLHWPDHRDQLAVNPELASSIESCIASGSRSLLRRGADS